MKPCDMCYGKGYLLDVNEDGNIERCDECKDTSYGFKSDKDALLHKTQDELDRYKQAYDILIDYWDLLPEEALQDIHKELAKIGL